ncbi:chaperone protein DnaJ [Nitzschia inconspicua]|uniref:Chaperone protein DnaJ n=1 Tax=Nitzschia inconspicua TaxID=303405 RepID=A0A9K3KL72_9STRA|nr:chaperone protein DnaJ [Nitzschia inconspicua]
MESSSSNAAIACHYDVLGVERDADAGTIKKAHRKLALKHHPDKNHGDDQAAEKFRLVQQAYEVLSDPQERTWYDDHRDAILAGWSTGNQDNDASANMLFQVVPYMHPGCYSGYHNDKGGFYQVYQQVFDHIVACETKQTEITVDLPTAFGSADSDWNAVRDFYQSWESFSSALNFAWEDQYNVHEDAPNRRVRRLMEEDNRKARKSAKKEYNNDILQLVAFVKRRDPRVKAKMLEKERQKREEAARQKQEMTERKKEQQKAKDEWRENARRELEQAAEEDRMAGRIRLADLEDDYDYGGGKKKKGKKKKNKQSYHEEEEEDEEQVEAVDVDHPQRKDGELSGPEDAQRHEYSSESELLSSTTITDTQNRDPELSTATAPDYDDDNADYFSSDEDSEDDEADVWRCECCRKEFKSEGQMENHMKSKKHKETFKKYEAKLKKEEEKLMAEMMDELQVG